MKSYLTFMSVLVSLIWLHALDRTVAALYSGGAWGLAYFWWSGSILICAAFLAGFLAVRRADEPETPPQSPSAERWGFLSSIGFALLALFVLQNCWERLREPQVAASLKLLQTLLTAIYCVGAALNLRRSHTRWQIARLRAKG